jgi:hypothetical protein
MSRLKIVDLSFFESELSNSSEVQGGYQPVASVSSSFSTANFAGYYGDWSIYKDSSGGYSIVANIYTGVGGAIAGAVSGAVSDGSVYAASYAQAST